MSDFGLGGTRSPFAHIGWPADGLKIVMWDGASFVDRDGVPVGPTPPAPRIPPGFNEEVIWRSTATQTVAALDTPATISFGAGGTSNTGILSIDAAGEITALKTGPLLVKQAIRVSRSGNSGIAHVVIWAEVSTDSGSTWTQTGNSAVVSLDQAIDAGVYFDLSPAFVAPGVKFRFRWARSSAESGINAGELRAFTPVGALSSLLPIASARLSVWRFNDYTYV